MRIKATFAIAVFALITGPSSIASTLSTYGSSNVEVTFSPDGQAQLLALKVINIAHRSVRLAAYSFTSPTVAKALLDAHRRGVEVR